MGTVAQLPLDPNQRQPQVSGDGLIAVHTGTSLREKVSDILTSATTEVWFVGISFDLVLPALRSAILERLRDGISFTFLFFDAQSENAERLADTMNIPIDDFSIRCQTSLTSLNRLRREWAEEAGSQEEEGRIRVRTTPHAPRFTAYLCDPDLPDTEEESDRLPKGYFIPSINNQESHELPAYECVRVPQGIYEAYLEGIRIEWDRCAESSTEETSWPDS